MYLAEVGRALGIDTLLAPRQLHLCAMTFLPSDVCKCRQGFRTREFVNPSTQAGIPMGTHKAREGTRTRGFLKARYVVRITMVHFLSRTFSRFFALHDRGSARGEGGGLVLGEQISGLGPGGVSVGHQTVVMRERERESRRIPRESKKDLREIAMASCFTCPDIPDIAAILRRAPFQHIRRNVTYACYCTLPVYTRIGGMSSMSLRGGNQKMAGCEWHN